MINKILKIIKYLIYKVHFFVFKAPPGEFTKRLIKNLFFAFFGVGGATLITFGFNVLAVRYLGPAEFGKWNLIGSIAQFFIILPLWGLATACLRYLGVERKNKGLIIGTSFRVVVLLSLLFFPLYFILAPVLQNILKIDTPLYSFALLYGLIFVFFHLFQSFFQGLEKFKKLSFLWIASAFIFVGIVCFYLFYLDNFSFKVLFWGNAWRLGFIIFVGILIFRKFLLKFSRQAFNKVFRYGGFSMLSAFAGFFSLGTIDNLMINYYLGPSAVGLYAAYYIVFSIFIGRVLNTFSQVFLPMASHSKDVKLLFRRSLRFIKKIGILILGGNFCLIWFLFKLYGKAFSFDWRLASLMALSVTLYCFLMILGNIIVSTGIRGARIGTIFAFSSATLNVVYQQLSGLI
ncbi:hypothetical protein ES703_39258 [subsurface metagenome]